MRSECGQLIADIETCGKPGAFILRGYVLADYTDANTDLPLKRILTKCYGNLTAAENDALDFLEFPAWTLLKHG
jgi:hypothetical protein